MGNGPLQYLQIDFINMVKTTGNFRYIQVLVNTFLG